MLFGLQPFIGFVKLDCHQGNLCYFCSDSIDFQNSNYASAMFQGQNASIESHSFDTDIRSLYTNIQEDSQTQLLLSGTNFNSKPSNQLQSSENLTLSDISEIMSFNEALLDDENANSDIIQPTDSFFDPTKKIINNIRESFQQKTAEITYQNTNYHSTQLHIPISTNAYSIIAEESCEKNLADNQTLTNIDNNSSDGLFQHFNSYNSMKDLNSKPNSSECYVENKESFKNESSFLNSKNQNKSTVNIVGHVVKSIQENFKIEIEKIKKENIKKFFTIRYLMKFIELKLGSDNTKFAKNQLFQLFMFQIRGIYFCIENNIPKIKNFKNFYDNFKNLKANRDLEFLRITSFNQMKIIQKDFIKVISIIKYVVLHNSVELFRFQENKIISEINRTMKSLGVKNFNIKHNYDAFNEIINSTTGQSDEIKINLKNELNYSKIELKFTNGYPKRMLSMCVHGQNAFILISNKFILNVILIKLDLVSLEYELFSRHYIDSEKAQNLCFSQKTEKILVDSVGNLYLIHKDLDEFEIVVLNQDLIRITMFTKNKYLNILRFEKLKICEVKMFSDMLYILDSENFIISAFDCHFNLIKTINIRNCVTHFVNIFVLISEKYLYLVSDDLIHVFSLFDNWLLVKNMPIPIKVLNIACTADDEIVFKTLRGKIILYKFDLVHNLRLIENHKLIEFHDSKYAKLVNFEIYNDVLYSLSKSTSSIYIIKNFTDSC